MLLFVAHVGLLVATLPFDPAIADLALVDQYGRTDSLAAHRDHVTVAMVVTARRLRNLKAWERGLRDRYEHLHYLRVVDIPLEPPVTHDQVATKLRKRIPEEVPVLIDLERAWATKLELDTARPNLLVFDRQGTLHARLYGRENPELFEELCGAIDRLDTAESP